jgi:hypothetical protein
MDVGDIIAGYAALIGTGAAAWPIWQARKARHPDVEVALFFTFLRHEGSGKELRYLFLEARNRGDHPVRVLTAGVSDGRLNYAFMPGRISVSKPCAAFPHAHIEDNFSDTIAQATPTPPPIPGIVLPRDAGSRMLPEEAAFAVAASLRKLRDDGEAYQDWSDEQLVEEVALDFDGELTGWVTLSTGEYFSTKGAGQRH